MERSDRHERESAERVEDAGECGGPWPPGRKSQRGCAGAVDEPAGQVEESGADCLSDDQSVGVMSAEVGGPADRVVSEDRDLEPCRVR